ncbi:uncharacterized protein LOC131951376 [Physella acuta]|uniref:uncharacterized protein LOC131951376 n=1 Tax=Physella acuta TaxID=109671 RepID=UPI0027DE90E4|nr:uncharacterized protein LOC131951376 [Physella acuta]
MDTQSQKDAEFIQKTIGNYLKDHHWTVSMASKEFLWDQLAFSFFADSKPTFTKEQVEIIQKITDKCMKQINNSTDSVSFSLIFMYVEPESAQPGVLIPLVRFVQELDANTCFIDYTGREYKSWDDFISQSNEGCKSFYVPSNGQYTSDKDLHYLKTQLKDNYKKFQLRYDSENTPSNNHEDLKNAIVEDFKNISKTFKLNGSKLFKQKIRLWFYQYMIDFNVVKGITTSIKEQFPDPDEIKKLDMLLKGFKEVTGETRKYLGNALFIKDIQHILECSERFKKLTLSDEGFGLACGLELHSKTFVQLTEDEKNIILEPGKEIAERKTLGKNFKEVLKTYSFQFKIEIHKAEVNIKKLLKVEDYNNFLLKDKLLWENLKQFQIIRLHGVLKNSCKSDDTFIQLGITFAERLECQDFDQFIAALEYATKLLNDKINELREEYKKTRVRKTNHDLKIEGDKFIREHIDEFCNNFTELMLECDKHKNENLAFCDLMVAAYHYKKHAEEYSSRELTVKEYLDIARTILCKDDIEFVWSQDGCAKKYYVTDTSHGATAIRIDRADGKCMIASLMFKMK